MVLQMVQPPALLNLAVFQPLSASASFVRVHSAKAGHLHFGGTSGKRTLPAQHLEPAPPVGCRLGRFCTGTYRIGTNAESGDFSEDQPRGLRSVHKSVLVTACPLQLAVPGHPLYQLESPCCISTN